MSTDLLEKVKTEPKAIEAKKPVETKPAKKAAAKRPARRTRAEEPDTKVRLGKDARVHEKTVKKVAKGKITPVKVRGRKRPARKPDVSTTLTSIKVLPEIWTKAMELSNNDRFRIEVKSPEEVVVWNNANWRVKK